MKLDMTIDGKTWEIGLERNETAAALLKMLPLEIEMTELNGNEKYAELKKRLPVGEPYSGRIEPGDLMLFGDRCLVLFYQGFNTGYTYTKIGHMTEPSGLADFLKDDDVEALLQEAPPFRIMDQETAHERMMSESGYAVLDVRLPEEYAEGHLPGARLLPHETIDAVTAAETLPDRDQPVYVYCRTGRRSRIAAGMLASLGYTRIMDIGGILDWIYETEG